MLNLKLWMQKVSQLLKTLKDTVSTHTTSLSNLDTTVRGHTTSLSNLNTTVSGHTTSINNHTSSINSHTTSINNLNEHVNNVCTKYNSIKISIAAGTTSPVEKEIDLATLFPGIILTNVIGVRCWLNSMPLPYVQNGVVQTWVGNDQRSGKIVLVNKTSAWSNYYLKVLLFYVKD